MRTLKRSHSEQQHPLSSPPLSSSPVSASTASLNTESSLGSHSQHHYTHGQLPRKGSKASVGSDSLWSVRDQPNSPYTPSSPVNHKASPRHPSPASIFRIKQKNRSTTSTDESSQDSYSENCSASRGSNVSVKDDLDRIHSAVDLGAAICSLGDGAATIKGRNRRSPYVFAQSHVRRPVTPIRCPGSPQLLLRVEASLASAYAVDTLVECREGSDGPPSRPQLRANKRPKASPHHPPSRSQQLVTIAFGGKSGSALSKQ